LTLTDINNIIKIDWYTMNIVMFTDAYWPRVNGVTVSVDSFSHALVNAGHDVLIVCSSYPQDADNPITLQKETEIEKKPKILKVPSLPVFISSEDRISKFYKWNWVFKHVDLFKPDLIHVNTEMVIAEFGFLYARIHNLPAVYTFHTMWEDYAPGYFDFLPVNVVKYFVRRILINVLNRSYRVIVPTPQIEKEVHKYKSDIITHLLPTGIDIKLFEHSKEESDVFRKRIEELFPQLQNKRILLFAGRVGKEKNIGLLLDILPKILEKYPDVILLIAGSGPDLEYYKEEARKKGIEESCLFPGYFSRNDLALVYTISEVFVFPSLTDTQGLVTLESMISGTPVVAIGVLGTLSVMGGNNGGFMVKNDAGEFTARVLDLLGDRELRMKKGQEAKIHASSWSIEELTKKLVMFYNMVIKDYTEDYGNRVTPAWEAIINKRWWKINNMIIKKRTRQNLEKLLTKLGINKLSWDIGDNL